MINLLVIILLILSRITLALNLVVERLPNNPIITPPMIENDSIVNINGPCLIKAPRWLPHQLGKYYLYFANHRGPQIHLAYADNLMGPWHVVNKDPLSIDEVAMANEENTDRKSHVASPDIYIDETNHIIRMYFHFRLPKLGHVSSIAFSADGLNFSVQAGTIGKTYLRHFIHNDYFYFVDKRGKLTRSKDGLNDFELGPNQIYQMAHDPLNNAHLRHTGLYSQDNKLYIFFSRIGDAPESILMSSMVLSTDWYRTKPQPPVLILKPQTDYEGAFLPVLPSQKGDAKGPQNQVRDPFIFADNNELYLLYSVAGEQGIAIAKLTKNRAIQD